MLASYVSANSFLVSGDQTTDFTAGRRIKADCDTDGIKYSTVLSSSYSNPNTTVTITESVLTNNLSDVLYGIINTGAEGSLPDHAHDGTEGTGGTISFSDLTDVSVAFTDLTDTPSSYIVDKFLKTTISGLVFSDIPVISGLDGTDGIDGIDGIDATASGLEFHEWHFGTGVPTEFSPAAEPGDYFYSEDSGNVYSRHFVGLETLVSDSFTGTTLNSSLWDTNIVPLASVTQDDVLELNNTSGDQHSGAQCYLITSRATEGTYIINCKWLPSIASHYNAGDGPSIAICAPGAARDTTYYGGRAQSFVKVILCQAGGFTTQRTQLRLTEQNDATSNIVGSLIDSISIDIDESVWHDLEIVVDWTAGDVSVSLDNDSYTLYSTISQSVLDAIGSTFTVEFSSVEYNITNTEKFDDFVLQYDNPNVWTLDSNLWPEVFTTYSGLEGNYLRVTASGIQAVDGIILTAPDQSEWVLRVTVSGVLYTEAV